MVKSKRPYQRYLIIDAYMFSIEVLDELKLNDIFLKYNVLCRITEI